MFGNMLPGCCDDVIMSSDVTSNFGGVVDRLHCLFINFWEPKGNYVFSLTDSCNINYKHTQKKYSIILGIIYHSLRKLNPSEHMPKYPFVNFWDPKGKYFFDFE